MKQGQVALIVKDSRCSSENREGFKYLLGEVPEVDLRLGSQCLYLFSLNLLNELLNEFVKLVDHRNKNVVQLRKSFLGMHKAPY